MKYIVLIICTSLIISCERDANVDFPDVESKLVVNCFLGTDQEGRLYATVGKSNPYIDQNSDLTYEVTDALVTINDVALEYTSSDYGDSYGAYEATVDDAYIQPGQTYTINVSAPGFESVSATCTVPLSPPEDFDLNNIEISDRSVLFDAILFDHTPNEINYYAMYAQVSSRSFNTQEVEYSPMFINGYENLFREQDFINGQASWNDLYVSAINGNEPIQLFVSLLNTDENFYRYYRTINTYSENLFGDPTITYSNIENGLGVFAAYNSLEKVYDLE